MAAVDTEEQIQQAKDEDAAVLDLLEPRFEAKEWKIGQGDGSEVFTQRPLGFFAKMEWYALVSAALDEVIQSEGGDEISVLLSRLLGDGIDTRDSEGVAAIVAAVSKLAMVVPDFLADSFCIWLGVPREKRTWAKWAMEQPESAGGLSDEDGTMIIETFIDQNAEAMRSFFASKGPALMTRIATRLNLKSGDQKPSSKPSRSTRRSTAGSR